MESIKICPVSTEPIPILIGGHSDAALRRAARLSDGWMHAGGDAEELKKMIGRLNELRREYGRENTPFEVHVISFDAYTVDGVKKLEDMGVTDCIVGFRDVYNEKEDSQTLEQKIAALNWYAEEIIAKV